MSGSRQLPASKAVVWEKLNDVETLKRCIPGCETLEKTSDASFKATSALKIGPMSVRFSGDVALKNLDPPNSYRTTAPLQHLDAFYDAFGIEEGDPMWLAPELRVNAW